VDGSALRGTIHEFLIGFLRMCPCLIGKEIEAVRKNYFSFTLTKESKVLCCSALTVRLPSFRGSRCSILLPCLRRTG
jgi:hypothetical protein